MKYLSTKTFGNNRELYTTYRHWQSQTDYKLSRGHHLRVRFLFEIHDTETPDHNKKFIYMVAWNHTDSVWIKNYIEELFDQTTIVAIDDPSLEHFKKMDADGECVLRILENVGCAHFAQIIYIDIAPQVLDRTHNQVRLKSVEVFEEDTDTSAIYEE